MFPNWAVSKFVYVADVMQTGSADFQEFCQSELIFERFPRESPFQMLEFANHVRVLQLSLGFWHWALFLGSGWTN